jgi:hypothetical protein
MGSPEPTVEDAARGRNDPCACGWRFRSGHAPEIAFEFVLEVT